MDGPANKRFLFGDFFFALRRNKLPVGLTEWMTLMEALAAGAVRDSLEDFYWIARAVLIKTEAHFDVYDEVFASVFRGADSLRKPLEEVLQWLQDPRDFPQLTAEQIAVLEQLPLDRLREQFEQRLREQTERHDGGNRWVGTGGTSAYGNGGFNPGGVRIGGGGGGRSAIRIADARRFREYRNDVVLDTRSMAVALKKLRKLSRTEGDPELDIDETVEKTSKNAGELEIAFVPPRKNEARVLLLMDVGGSMDPYAQLVERLFSAASNLHHWRKFEAFEFHNCVYSRVDKTKRGREHVLTAELLNERPRDTFVIFVGDAYMAPSELLDTHGAIDYSHLNSTPGIVWLHRIRERFPNSVWLNPIPEKSWYGWTIKMVGQIFPMYTLTLNGIEDAVTDLVRQRPRPAPNLEDLLPNLGIPGI